MKKILSSLLACGLILFGCGKKDADTIDGGSLQETPQIGTQTPEVDSEPEEKKIETAVEAPSKPEPEPETAPAPSYEPEPSPDVHQVVERSPDAYKDQINSLLPFVPEDAVISVISTREDTDSKMVHSLDPITNAVTSVSKTIGENDFAAFLTNSSFVLIVSLDKTSDKNIKKIIENEIDSIIMATQTAGYTINKKPKDKTKTQFYEIQSQNFVSLFGTDTIRIAVNTENNRLTVIVTKNDKLYFEMFLRNHPKPVHKENLPKLTPSSKYMLVVNIDSLFRFFSSFTQIEGMETFKGRNAHCLSSMRMLFSKISPFYVDTRIKGQTVEFVTTLPISDQYLNTLAKELFVDGARLLREKDKAGVEVHLDFETLMKMFIYLSDSYTKYRYGCFVLDELASKLRVVTNQLKGASELQAMLSAIQGVNFVIRGMNGETDKDESSIKMVSSLITKNSEIDIQMLMQILSNRQQYKLDIPQNKLSEIAFPFEILGLELTKVNALLTDTSLFMGTPEYDLERIAKQDGEKAAHLVEVILTNEFYEQMINGIQKKLAEERAKSYAHLPKEIAELREAEDISKIDFQAKSLLGHRIKLTLDVAESGLVVDLSIVTDGNLLDLRRLNAH